MHGCGVEVVTAENNGCCSSGEWGLGSCGGHFKFTPPAKLFTAISTELFPAGSVDVHEQLRSNYTGVELGDTPGIRYETSILEGSQQTSTWLSLHDHVTVGGVKKIAPTFIEA